jgi:hypothetical protein
MKGLATACVFQPTAMAEILLRMPIWHLPHNISSVTVRACYLRRQKNTALASTTSEILFISVSNIIQSFENILRSRRFVDHRFRQFIDGQPNQIQSQQAQQLQRPQQKP